MSYLYLAILALLLQDQPTVVKGRLTHKNVEMTVVDSLAVWDKKANELLVVFLPFKAEQRHIDRLRSGRTSFFAMGEPSPDPKKWPNYCPAVWLRVSMNPKVLTTGSKAIKSYQMGGIQLNLKEAGETISNADEPSAQRNFKRLVLNLDATGAGTLDMEFAGASAFYSDDGIAWNMMVKLKVAPALEGQQQ